MKTLNIWRNNIPSIADAGQVKKMGPRAESRIPQTHYFNDEPESKYLINWPAKLGAVLVVVAVIVLFIFEMNGVNPHGL